MPPELPADLADPQRLAAVQRLLPLDARSSSALDRLTALVARHMSAPLVLLTAVGVDSTTILSGAGSLYSASTTADLPHEATPCAQIVRTGQPLLASDPQQTASAMLLGDPRAAATCAGAPIYSAEGLALGALSVIAPRSYTWPQDTLAELQESAALAGAILEQYAALADLRARDELQQTLFRHAPIGQSLGTMDGWILTANPALCAMLGYTEAELLQLHFPTLTHPDDRALTFSYMQRLVSGEQPFFDFEKRYLHKDGSVVHVRSTVAVVRDAAGQPRYNIGLIQNITEHKQLEAQLLQAQKMESIGQLAGGIAHDFNNLLTVMLGCGQIALDSLAPDAPAYAPIQAIMHSSRRAAALTRQLLAFARRSVIEPHTLNLNDLLIEMDGLLQRLIPEDISLVTIPGPELGLVRADPGQIEQVIVNLVVNARDAMPRGGTLTIETSNVQLDNTYAQHHLDVRPGPYILIAVTDTGIGISADVQERLFEPFFTTKPQGKGTGLGLATCYGIVKQHGGSIWVYSEVGHGSTFKIYIPQVEGVVTIPERVAEEPILAGGSERILLVEDEDDVRQLVSDILTQRGYTVYAVANGVEALQLLDEQPNLPFELLVTDVVMPHLGGPGLVELLMARRPQLRVLFMSGYTTRGIVQGGWLEAGVSFLQKPFTPIALLRKVRGVLDADDALPPA